VKRPLVLHVTPHLPGGLGRILLSTLKFSENITASFAHEIVITDEKHLTVKSREMFSKYSDCLHIGKNDSFIKEKMDKADIVQIEWWNHPLVNKFLANFPFPPSRVILCCHVNGLSRPSIITESAVEFSDIFLAATKATRKHPLFQSEANVRHRKKLRYVTYPVNFERFGTIQPKAHDGFNIGYVGTLDYAKMHRNFLPMSDAIDVPKIKFFICGDGFDKKTVELEAQKYPVGKFQFMGFLENIKSILEIIDVFGYPLNAKHYGSGEQAVNEAMYAGLPVVAFSNPAEQEIISHDETGILVDNEQSYTETIKALYLNPAERTRIGMNARKRIIEHFSPLQCFQKLESIYKEVMGLDKRSRTFKKLIESNYASGNDLGARLFIESLGDQGLEFLQSYKSRGEGSNADINKIISEAEIEMKMVTKGTLFQYLYFFPDDAFLNFWAGLISQADDKVLKRQHISIPKTTTQCFEKAAHIDTKNKEFKFYLEQSK